MLCSFPVDHRLLGNVAGCLFLLVAPQPRLEIAFPTLTAIDEGYRVFAFPSFARPDECGYIRTDSARPRRGKHATALAGGRGYQATVLSILAKTSASKSHFCTLVGVL